MRNSGSFRDIVFEQILERCEKTESTCKARMESKEELNERGRFGAIDAEFSKKGDLEFATFTKVG